MNTTCQTVEKVLREDMATMDMPTLHKFATEVMGVEIQADMTRKDIEDDCVAVEQSCFVK